MIERGRRLLRSKFIRDTLILQAGKLGTTGLSFVSLVLTVRLMGPENYGVWKLVLALYAIWLAFDLTGIGISTATRLSIAIGRKDGGDILDQLAFYIKVGTLWSGLTVIVVSVLGPPLARQMYDGDTHVGVLAGWFSFTMFADMLYNLVIVSLQSRRAMRDFALLQNANQVVLTVCVVTAMLISATPESMVAARLVYSYTTMLMGLWVYGRLRGQGVVAFPPLGAVFRRALTISPRGYWRSGVAMALDKNTGNLFTQIPLTLVGVLSGETAAGYLGIALDTVARSSIVTSAILDNMQAFVPQAVGRGEFARLRRSFARVLGVMGAAGVAFYGLLALLAPWLVPLFLGSEAAPAAPVLTVLAVYGAVTTVGGIFGPLYRAFDMMRKILLIKVFSLILVLLPGVMLIQQAGAVGGAWVVNGLLVVSVVLTAAATLPALAAQPAEQPPSARVKEKIDSVI